MPEIIEYRTFGILISDFQETDHKKTTEYQPTNKHSTINPSLIEEPDHIRVIDKVPLPELHLLLGVVNLIFWGNGGLIHKLKREKDLDLTWATEKALQYANKANAVSEAYHGRVSESGACSDLLKEADYLLSNEFLVNVEDPFKIVPICRTGNLVLV